MFNLSGKVVVKRKFRIKKQEQGKKWVEKAVEVMEWVQNSRHQANKFFLAKNDSDKRNNQF